MWNFNFMLPSLMILAIILCYYFAWPRLPVRMNRAFLAIVLSDCLVILFDLLSSRADSNYAAHTTGMLYFLNMGFFVLYLVRIYCFFVFTEAILHIPCCSKEPRSLLPPLVFLLSELITLSSFFTGAVFRIESDGYHRGPLYDIIYVCFFFYIIYSLILLILYRHRLNSAQLVSAVAAQLVLFLGNIIRILFPNYIVMNMFCLMAVFILFLGFLNPTLYRASLGNAYNLKGLREILDEHISGDDFGLFAFAVKDYADIMDLYGAAQIDKGIALISQFMADHYPDLIVYYLLGGYYVVTGLDEAQVPKLHQDLMTRFREPWRADQTDLYLRSGFLWMKPDERMKTTERVIDFLYVGLGEAARSDTREEELIDSSFFIRAQQLTTIKRSLQDAIDENSIEVYLMPIMDAHTGKLKYAEALSRIKDKDGQVISPALFIPLAERSGQINAIGMQVLEKVCRFINKNHPEKYGMQWINVNLSPVQFLNRNLCSQFLEILRKYDVNPEQIHLELTEQTIQDVHELKQQTDRLTEAGFLLSLDDYGQGYSNLTRLNSLPFADIKIDMEVVWDYCAKKDILLPSLITTLKKLGFSVTAEGIETEEMAELMRDAGCDYLQGYLFSKPLPTDEFIDKYSV